MLINVSFVFFFVHSIIIGKRLNEYISNFEPLNYDEKHIHASHNRAKRSVTKDNHVFVKFKALDKRFHIRLKRDLSTFSDNLVVSIFL